ncbi:recombinase family protein [Halorussus pelagicus]|uniref:recombinase family protein n=1 Tax=Halorussus pelagicus TaxID=2505977 RepID=UPI000FFBFB73|nr:recombinase family protein [Halorussus pelagicus]
MTRNVAAYVRVSTADQDEERQRESILNAYEADDVEWFVDVESGASLSRDQYNELRDRVTEFDTVVTAEIDRLGRSFSELASFVEDLRNRNIDLYLTQQPIDTRDADGWMADLMLNMLIVFADAEQKMIQDRVQQGIDKAKRDGKRIGRPPFGYDVEDGFMYQDPVEYNRAQNFIREVKKGRAKSTTAEYFEIPKSAVQSILKRSHQNYEIPFDNDQWKVKRAKVEAGEKLLDPLESDD